MNDNNVEVCNVLNVENIRSMYGWGFFKTFVHVVMKLALVSMYLVKSNLIPILLTLVQLSKTDSCGSLRKISNISRARLPRFRKIDSRTQ